MLRTISILLAAMLPLFLRAQDSTQIATADATSSAASLQPLVGSDDASLPPALSGRDPTASSARRQQSSQQKSKPTKPKPENERPPAEGSMVGYIDNAIVGSQIRVRFDAAFHNNAPDRAEFFYAQYAGLGPNAPGPNSVVADLNFQQLYLQAEYAPTRRFSFFTEVPLRWIQPQVTVANTGGPLTNVNEAGLSDVAAGFKFAAVASSNQYLTFQFQAYFPSGNASTGLGTDHYSVEPALLYYRRFSDRVALEAEAGDSHPIGGSSCLQTGPLPAICVADTAPLMPPKSEGFAGDVFFYGVGPSYALYQGDHVQIAPVVELVGWRVLGGLETICTPGIPCSGTAGQEAVSADGTNIVNIKMGARTTVTKHNSFYIGYGHQLTHAVWYKEIVRLEYRYSF